MIDDDKLGTLVQRCDLPKSANMDAIEARVVPVQEVPPKSDLRFFAVRGDVRTQLTSTAAQATLRAYVPPKPLGALSEAELLVEILFLRLENDRMRPVYENAKAWRRAKGLGQIWDTRQALTLAIDAAVTKEGEGR